MHVSVLSALIIQSGNVVCRAVGPNPDGKYMGVVVHTAEKHGREILSTDPVYPDAASAKAAAEDVVAKIRPADLEPIMSGELGLMGEEPVEIAGPATRKSTCSR